MKKSWKTIIAFGMALTALSVTDVFAKAKAKSTTKEDPLESAIKNYKPIKDPKTKKTYDLGGMEVIVADWFTAENQAAPKTAEEEARAKWLKFLENTYHFTIVQKKIDDWGQHGQKFVQVATNGDKKNYVFCLYQNSISAQMKAKLFYDLATLPALDFSNPKWQPTVKQLMSQGKKVYGMRAIDPEPRGGLFFNKRLLTEAGIKPDTIYDLQKNGQWTWDNFDKLCSKILRDTNNDGVMDVYPMASFSKDYYQAVVYSNNATFIGRDANGKYTNGTTSDNFLEAMNWGTEMLKKYEMPTPDGAEWNWAYSAFQNGQVAIQVTEEYKAGDFSKMKDDYGFVCFPKGPKAKDYANYQYDNVFVIPASYDKDRANKIAFAFNLFTEKTPGYEDSDSWKNSYYTNFRDTRAVDETIARMLKNGIPIFNNVINIDVGDIVYGVGAFAKTPAEAIEENKNKWQAIIDEANGVKK